MKSIRVATKYLVLFFLAVVFCLGVASVLFYESNIPQQAIKQIIEHELSKIFKWEVTIESLSGSLLRGVKAKNVRFSNHEKFPGTTVLEIGEAHVHYSVIKAIQKGGDFAAASSLIEATDVKVNMVRDKRDLWNIFFLVPPPPTNVGYVRRAPTRLLRISQRLLLRVRGRVSCDHLIMDRIRWKEYLRQDP